MKQYFKDFCDMKLSIIIVNYNTNDLTKACVASIKNSQTKSSYEIIIVDNASNPAPKQSSDYQLIKNNENLGFSKANNIGLKASRGEYKLLLNSDTEVEKGAIDELINFAESNPDAGVVGPKLLNKDGTLQASCFNFPTVFRAIRQYWFGEKGLLDKFFPKGNLAQVVDSVVGAAMLITPRAIKKVGFLDEKYFMYFEDIDYCKKIKAAGLKVYYLPSSGVTHLHGESGKDLAKKEDQWRRLVPSSKIYHGIVKHVLISFIILTGQKWQKFSKKR